jgi:dCTP deaminase
MSVLSRKSIEDRLRLEIDKPGSLVVTPLLLPQSALDYDSIDLRLGSFFLIRDNRSQPVQDPTRDVQAPQFYTRVHVPIGSFFVIPAHETVLGATLEFIKLPNDLSGQILTKSSIARTFMVIETAPWVHPLYRGCLTLEIANVSNTPLLVFPGLPIGQLVLMQGDTAAPDGMPSSSYLGPVFPEPAPYKHPKVELAQIGIKEYLNPTTGCWERTALSPSPGESDRREILP